MAAWCGCRWGCTLAPPPIGEPKPPAPVPNPPDFPVGSRGLIISDMTPPRERHEPGTPPFFFFDLEESFRLRVWIPSFFMVSGRFTCEQKKMNALKLLYHILLALWWGKPRTGYYGGYFVIRAGKSHRLEKVALWQASQFVLPIE